MYRDMYIHTYFYLSLYIYTHTYIHTHSWEGSEVKKKCHGRGDIQCWLSPRSLEVGILDFGPDSNNSEQLASFQNCETQTRKSGTSNDHEPQKMLSLLRPRTTAFGFWRHSDSGWAEGV